MKEEIYYFAWIPLLAFIIGRWSKKKERSQNNHYFFHLNLKLNEMAEQFQDFKDRLLKQGESIETIKTNVATIGTSVTNVSTSVDGIKADVKYIKDLAANNPEGFSAEQVAELSGILDLQDAKIEEVNTSITDVQASVTKVADTTSQLDAETDPNANGGEGTGETV